jgi:DNA-binding FadR family transcriptional regulator
MDSVSLSSLDAAIRAFQHHQQIFDAIRKREPSPARKAMETHLDAMGKVLMLTNGF